MSWVSLSGSEGGDSGNQYKEVARQAFASPTNLSSRLGNRAPAQSREGLSVTASVASRRIPSRINSDDEAEAFHQMFNSTAVKVSKKNAEDKSSDLGQGLKALAKKASRQYYADLNSTDAEASGSLGKESFSIGSVSRRTKDLDLAHNDNSFHVIGGLIVEFFQSKLKEGDSDLRLSRSDLAQLDRLAPPRVRASFVEAVRYRFTNSAMDSTSSVYMLARQCHELGLDAEGPQNPLLAAAETEIVIPFPRGNKKSSTSSRSASSAVSDSDGGESATPSGTSSSHSYQKPRQTSHIKTNGQSGLAAANPSPYTSNFSRPPRQNAEDPPAEDPPEGPVSISTRLTKLGVELPFGSEKGSAENASSAGSVSGSAAQSQASKSQKSETSAVIGEGSVRTSLTKYGIEMPRYPEATNNCGENKSAANNSGKEEHQALVEAEGSNGPSSAQSQSAASAASVSSCQKSNASSAGIEEAHNEPLNEKTMDSPILSMSSKAESSIIQVGSSKDFSNSVGLAKQQLQAELREAENLMAESKTQEAAKFWRDHVLELEARLRALNGEEGSVASNAEKDAVRTGVEPEQKYPTDFAQEDARPMDPGDMAVQYGVSPDGDFNSVPSGRDTWQNRHSHYAMEEPRAPLMIDPSLEGVPMVDVVAPADLPGGYHFEAEIEGRRFLATVPAGGVQKGETFSCYMRDLEKVGSDIPVGRWRDGLFDCCSTGFCHPVIGNALFCPLVILGQIMSRVGFDFLGRPSLDNSTNGPNNLWTILCFWVFVNLALFSAYNFKWSRGMELSMADLGALAFVNVAYILFVVYLTSATRGSLREKYYIRESRFHDLEDCCCATFCLPCALCQMARHTADYDEYEGVCCNQTGLPDSYEATGVEATKQSSNYLV